MVYSVFIYTEYIIQILFFKWVANQLLSCASKILKNSTLGWWPLWYQYSINNMYGTNRILLDGQLYSVVSDSRNIQRCPVYGSFGLGRLEITDKYHRRPGREIPIELK